MKDLRDAIKRVIEDAEPIEGNGVSHLSGYCSVDTNAIKLLAAEYNIHFVEPDEEQLGGDY